MEELSETVRVAARAPVTVGLKETDTVQPEDAARVDPQVLLDMMKSPGLVPVTAMLLMVIEALVPLLRVAVWVALEEPMFTVPNENEVGLMVTEPEVLGANPERATV